MRGWRTYALSLMAAAGFAWASLADAVGVANAGSAAGASNEVATVDRLAPNFVKASLLVFGPSETLYGCAGHVAFRMQCPTHKLDYAFSYEGEDVSHQILRFFAGRLKMGMFSVPTADFLELYRKDGRSATEYALNMSPAAKVRLWKRLDDLVAKGNDLPYDYIKRGCAQSTLQTLLASIRPEVIEHGMLPKTFNQSRRELLHDYIADSPWTCLLLHALCGPEADFEAAPVDKIITPKDMIAYLATAQVGGRPILSGEVVALLPQTLQRATCPITPMMVSLAILAVTVAGCVWYPQIVTFILLTLLLVFGLAETYVVVVSNLPASSWNWLIIPFNPLPVLCWRYRRFWALPMAMVLVAWELFMLFAPHRLTDPSLCVLTCAYILLYVRMSKFKRGNV